MSACQITPFKLVLLPQAPGFVPSRENTRLSFEVKTTLIGCIDDGGLAGEVRSTYPKASPTELQWFRCPQKQRLYDRSKEVERCRSLRRRSGLESFPEPEPSHPSCPSPRWCSGPLCFRFIAEVKHAFVVGKSGDAPLFVRKVPTPVKVKLLTHN